MTDVFMAAYERAEARNDIQHGIKDEFGKAKAAVTDMHQTVKSNRERMSSARNMQYPTEDTRKTGIEVARSVSNKATNESFSNHKQGWRNIAIAGGVTGAAAITGGVAAAVAAHRKKKKKKQKQEDKKGSR